MQSRLIGIGFLLMGMLHFVAGLVLVVTEFRSPPADGHSPYMDLIFVGSGLASMAIGRWLCRRPTYRPDLGDANPMLGKSEGYSKQHLAERGPRNWWTGDPIAVKSLEKGE